MWAISTPPPGCDGVTHCLPVTLARCVATWLGAGCVAVNAVALTDPHISSIDVLTIVAPAGAQSGYTALHKAAAAGQENAVRFLLEKGASTAAMGRPNRETALHVAAAAGHYSTVQLLLQHGADASVKDKNGRKALYHAKMFTTTCAPGRTREGEKCISQIEGWRPKPLSRASREARAVKGAGLSSPRSPRGSRGSLLNKTRDAWMLEADPKEKPGRPERSTGRADDSGAEEEDIFEKCRQRERKQLRHDAVETLTGVIRKYEGHVDGFLRSDEAKQIRDLDIVIGKKDDEITGLQEYIEQLKQDANKAFKQSEQRLVDTVASSDKRIAALQKSLDFRISQMDDVAPKLEAAKEATQALADAKAKANAAVKRNQELEAALGGISPAQMKADLETAMQALAASEQAAASAREEAQGLQMELADVKSMEVERSFSKGIDLDIGTPRTPRLGTPRAEAGGAPEPEESELFISDSEEEGESGEAGADADAGAGASEAPAEEAEAPAEAAAAADEGGE